MKKIAYGMVYGLKTLHDLGFTHRDFKPQNVMLDGADRAIIIDFGLANSRGVGSGTPEYYAPEQAAQAGSARHTFGKSFYQNIDKWSLGLTIYNSL